MKQTIKLFALAALGLFVSFAVSAQVTTSSVSGKISDAQGPVVGAAVIATHTPSGTQYYTVTDNNGQYRINSIVPGGPYTIQIEMLGYQKLSVTEIYAPLAETLVADATLKEEAIGLDAATVVADASESGMNIRRSGASTTISERTKDNMPSVSRSMNDIMALTPQSSSTTSGFAVGGGNYRGSTVTVDGAAFNNAFGIGQNLPAGGTPISLDALEQISINVTPFDVRQSGFQGGAINAVTKSGSNEWHASVYDYYTSGGLRGYKADGAEVAFAPSLNNTLGFTLGGPIVKNKLFFFVNFEYAWDKVPGSSKVARETGAEEWGGNSKYNRPTVAALEDIKQFLSENCNGYNPGRYQGYDLSTPDYKILARIDWNISKYNKFNIRFSNTHTSYSNPPSSSMSPIGGTNSVFTMPNGTQYKWNRYSAGRQSDYTMPFESARYGQDQSFMSLAAELNTRFRSGKGTNTARVAWSHQYEPRSYTGGYFPTIDIMSTEDVTGTDNTAAYTSIGPDPFTFGNLRDVQTIIATDEVTFNVGKHNLLAGLQYEWNRTKNGYMQGGAGWFIYDSIDTFKKDVTNPDESSLPMAFMITHANVDDPTQQVFPAFDYAQYSAYVQDEISFSDNFKMTAGIRFEVPEITIPTDNNNKAFAAIASNPDNAGTSFAGLSTADVPQPRLTVSPRIGFNWDVAGNRKFIIRGGTGMYTGRIPFVWLVSAIGNDNCLQYQYIANDKNPQNPKVHFNTDRSEIINSVWNGTWQKQDLAAPTAGTILDKNLRMPSSWKSSLAFDANLPGGVKATLEGTYSYNFAEVYATPLGYAKTGSIRLPGEPEAREVWTAETLADGAKAGGYYATNINGNNGYYYSITVQLSKSFKNGLDLMAAYTNARGMSVTDGNGDQISEFANTYAKNGSSSPELGYSNYVAPNRVIANASWTIDEGKYTATKLSAFYEGYNLGYISSYSYSRVSYLMNNVSGGTGASQMIYIPTEMELSQMPFVDEANKLEFNNFIANDRYLSTHRGKYMERNGATAPWLNRINVRVAQDFFFNIAGRKQTLEIGLDIKNLGNLLDSQWGLCKQMSSNIVLNYDKAAEQYTFTKPTWNTLNGTASTWQMLLSAKWFF